MPTVVITRAERVEAGDWIAISGLTNGAPSLVEAAELINQDGVAGMRITIHSSLALETGMVELVLDLSHSIIRHVYTEQEN